MLALSLSSYSIIITPTTDSSTLSLHDALPISLRALRATISCKISKDVPTGRGWISDTMLMSAPGLRSEEHTSELQSSMYLVWRLLLEKKNDREHIMDGCQLARERTRRGDS